MELPVLVHSYKSKGIQIDDYLYLFLNDNDYFTKWDAGQFLMRSIIKARLGKQENYELEDRFIKAIKKSIQDLKIKDPSFLATLLTIPGFSELESLFEKVDPINIYKETLNFQVLIGMKILEDLKQ